MRAAKLTIVFLLVVVLGAILHYTLPRHEVVRIVGVETRLEQLGWNRIFFSTVPVGTGASEARDVRFIEALRPSGRERVFRNEDTGWIWPPFFKFNSSDMQARARNLVSTEAEPRWIAITYYGIRSQLFSIYPNVLRVREVAGPDVTIIPWSRIIGFVVLAALATWVYFALYRFRRQRLEPFIDRIGDKREAAGGRLRRFWRGLFGG